MGAQQDKIDTKNVPYLDIAAILPNQQIKYVPPFRKFKAQYLKHKGKIVDCFVSVVQPYDQNIQFPQPIYKDLEQAFEQKTKDIMVQTALFDQMYFQRYTYLVKNSNKPFTICLRPFHDYQSHAFGNVICQIDMAKTISQLNQPHLIKLQQHYIIQTGLEEEQQPNTQILIFEPVATNLSQIIKYRKENNWLWTVNEFNYLVNCMLQALQKLHSNGITHNDIRPCNIYYSTVKKTYVLGSFSNALFFNGRSSNKVNLNLRASKAFGDPQLIEAKSSNLFSSDIYSLGMSLLSAFYLLEPISRKGTAPYNRKLQDTYQCLKIIRNMIKPSAQDRPNVSQLRKTRLPVSQPEKMDDLIQSLRYKNRPKNAKLAKSNRAIAVAYQRLGIWEQWKDHLAEAFQIQQIEIDDFNKAKSLKQLAQVQYNIGQLASSSDYAKKSTKLFRNLGYNCINEGNFDGAISHFTKALQCRKYYENEYDYDVAKNLQGLAIAHSEKNQYELAKPLFEQAVSVVEKSKGRDSNQYIQLNISLAKLETDYQQFDHSNEILQQCLQLSQSKIKINEQLGKKTKAQILQEMGRNFMNQATFQPDKMQQVNKKSQLCLAQALRINQSLDFDNHLQIADNLCAIGQVYFRKKQYTEAKILFQKALAMRDHYYNKYNQSPINKQRAGVLCHLANCDTCLNEHQKAMQNYNKAIQIYKKVYGTDHNRDSALAIGNLGRVYYQKKDMIKAKQCIRCAYNILGELQGTDDPDYEHFKSIEERINNETK